MRLVNEIYNKFVNFVFFLNIFLFFTVTSVVPVVNYIIL